MNAGIASEIVKSTPCGRLEDGRWMNGVSGNPHGRPRVAEIDLVRQAIEEVSVRKKKSLWVHLIEQCYVDNGVLIAVARRFLPETIEVGGLADALTVIRARYIEAQALDNLQNVSQSQIALKTEKPE